MVIMTAEKYNLSYKERSNHITIFVPDTKAAIPILNEISPYINSYEVVQGTMDDVFLNITGKQLVETV
jgi:multidrug/hemolysin transport system ATP-binding protein